MSFDDVLPASDTRPKADTGRFFEEFQNSSPKWTVKVTQKGPMLFDAINAPQLPEQPLQKSESELADSIIKNAQGMNDEMQKVDWSKEMQFRLDLARQMSCLSRQDLDKLLPHVNNALEHSGLRIVNFQDNKGDELWIAKRDSRDNKYHVSGLIGKRVDYCVPTT